MAETHEERYNRLLPNGQPHYIRAYDNNFVPNRNSHRSRRTNTADRYTIVFTGRYPGKATGGCLYLIGSRAIPSEGGIRRVLESDDEIIDRSGHLLGMRITFYSLPMHLQATAAHEYRRIWGLVDRNETSSIAEWHAPNYLARLESRGS